MCAGGGSQMIPVECVNTGVYAIYLIDALMRWLSGLKTSMFNVINIYGTGLIFLSQSYLPNMFSWTYIHGSD